jgi:hypothetical protein
MAMTLSAKHPKDLKDHPQAISREMAWGHFSTHGFQVVLQVLQVLPRQRMRQPANVRQNPGFPPF